MRNRSGFTLIELLVVIAILAVLAVVVVLVLNPAGLLQESRDANHRQDMATINNAIGYSLADNAGESIGTANTVYLSVPDPVATSTAGDQCQGLGLPSLPAGVSYQCASPTYYRKTDGTGWIPVNLSANTFGSSLGQLPTDPINSTSTGLYYSYATNGSQFEVASIFESQKYKLQYGNNPLDPDYPEVNAKGSNLALNPLYNPSGLVGWWPLDEGSGSIAYDQSGNGNNGTWIGTASGTSGYYSAGKVGSWAGYFSGSSGNYVSSIGAPSSLEPSHVSVTAWIQESSAMSNAAYIGFPCCTNGYALFLDGPVGPLFYADWNTYSASTRYALTQQTLSYGSWYFIAGTFDGSSMHMYFNGKEVTGSPVSSTLTYAATTFGLGEPNGNTTPYEIDDVRVYNRLLSAAEVQALYNAEH